MNILIFTQKVDADDPVLGFFHQWLKEFSINYDFVYVICLSMGTHTLPDNVRIFSLGKERKLSKIKMFSRLCSYVFFLTPKIKHVFVHMNQEYVLLFGLFFRFFNKKIVLWRNHPKGTFFTKLAVLFSHASFCTSNESFIASMKKVVRTGVGVDTTMFFLNRDSNRSAQSIAIVGRIDPIKNIETLVDSLNILAQKGIDLRVYVYGESSDSEYEKGLKRYIDNKNLTHTFFFCGKKKYSELPEIYSTHELYVNLTPSGSFDKTIVEATLCGMLPIVSNKTVHALFKEDLKSLCFVENDALSLSRVLEHILTLGLKEKEKMRERLVSVFLPNHSLSFVVSTIVNTFSKI